MDSIQQLPIKLAYQVQDHNAGLAPYFRDMLKRTMTAKKPKRSNYKYIDTDLNIFKEFISFFNSGNV